MMKSNENNGAVTKSFAKKMESISPFELKNKLIEMADESIKKIAHTMLNAELDCYHSARSVLPFR